MAQPMERFIGEVRELVQAGGTEEEITARVAACMKPIIGDPDLLTADQLLVKKAGFTLNRIHIEPDGSFSIGAGIWDVGQRTPVHDHGTWGVIGIHRGAEKEESFRREAARVMDGRAAITPSGTRIASAGDVFVCCTTDRDVHRVACHSAEPVVGIHVYGGDLAKIPRLQYDPDTGEVAPFQTGWDYAKVSA